MTEPLSLDLPMSVLGRHWRLREADEGAADRLRQRFGLPELVAHILATRGVTDETAEAYLDTSVRRQMPDPFSVVDLERGAKRIAATVEAVGAVGIFGDYDVDGGTGTAILTRFLRGLGITVHTHIPDRRGEGYGPSPEAFESLLAKGAELIITVDCGTTSFPALEWADGKGAHVVVVDHHLPTGALPPCYALINPQRADDESGLNYLSAAGVAFLLAVGLNKVLRESGYYERTGKAEPNLLQYLDLAALGTVCDVVDLQGLNRAYVAQGLKVLGTGGNPGLAALSKIARVNSAPSTYHLGFVFGPRLNAGGRLGPSDHALKLLTSDDPGEVQQIARELDALNAERRAVEQAVLDQAIVLADDQAARGARVIVAASEGWHEGVIGIVAGRLKDRTGLPALCVTIGEDGLAKGSGRSIKGVDLGRAVVAAAEEGVLVKGGGHEMAAGLTVAASRIDELTAYLHKKLAADVEVAIANRVSHLDGIVGLGAIDDSLSDALALAGPYGAGNPEPIVLVRNVLVSFADRVGQDHVRAVLKGKGGTQVKGIAFRAADGPLGALLMEGTGAPVHLIGRIKEDTWNGRRQIQLQIEDACRP